VVLIRIGRRAAAQELHRQNHTNKVSDLLCDPEGILAILLSRARPTSRTRRGASHHLWLIGTLLKSKASTLNNLAIYSPPPSNTYGTTEYKQPHTWRKTSTTTLNKRGRDTRTTITPHTQDMSSTLSDKPFSMRSSCDTSTSPTKPAPQPDSLPKVPNDLSTPPASPYY
jgi:hypothetical protein